MSRPDGTGGVPSGDTRPIVELELAGARPRWGTIATIAYSDGYRGGTGQVRAQETRSMRVTPEEQRAGQRSRSAPDGNLYLCVDVTVTQGAVGVLVTSLDGVEIGEAHRDQVDQYVAAVPLPSAGSAGESGSGTSTPVSKAGRVQFRNVGADGQEARFRVGRVWVQAGLPADPPLVTVEGDPFNSFTRWSGRTPSGYWADWLGQQTNAEFFDFREELRRAYAEDIADDCPSIPNDSEHALDWAPLLESVLCADRGFTMVALGAGWGRWLTAGWLAARQRELDVTLVGVEAEPTHFSFLQDHLAHNGVPPEKVHLWHAAATGRSGEVSFATGSPDAWWGQSVIGEGQDYRPPGGVEDFKPISIRAVTLEEVTDGLGFVDYVHLDIQGAEAEVIKAALEADPTRYGCINVGTHGRDIDAALRETFTAAGWRCLHDVPTQCERFIRIGDRDPELVSFQDGVQVWVNPATRSVP